MSGKIDIVIPWVDGNDPEWQKEKNKYDSSYSGDKAVNRYRDWDMLQYVFRGIDKNLPWIRKVHFVTWGHIPSWLNTDCEKLNIVKHVDYIPKEYLPTFSANPIELNLHRIKGLSEQFIYSNDDFFFLAPMEENDFFDKGLPKDSALMNIHQFRKGGIDHIIASDLEVINENFNKREVIKNNKSKFYSFKYKKGLLKNIYFFPCGSFVGFELKHVPQAYLKSTLKEVWSKEFDILDKTSKNKFRSPTDVNQYLFRYWQIASGKFITEEPTKGRFFSIGKDDPEIKKAIEEQSYKMICLSDDDVNIDFEMEKNKICEWLNTLFPEKSKFEK